MFEDLQLSSENNLNNPDIQESQALVEQVHLFDDVVSHSYLQKLSECEVVEFSDMNFTTMRWYSITKIVMEKNAFFPDKLSMLYMALHSVAKNIVLIVNKNVDSHIQFFIGARDFEGNSNTSGEILDAGLHGYLPGVKTKVFTKGTPGNQYDVPFVSSVSGIASFRDDKKENFVQGIEKLINATSQIPRYTAYFIADNIPEHEARTIISAFNDLYNKISPFAESQITISENQTEGVSESLTENFSQSISKTLSETITNTFGTSESTTRTAGKSHTKNKNSSHGYSTPSLLGMFLGAYSYNKSKGTADTTQNSTAIQKGSNESHARASQTGEARQDQHGKSQQKGTNKSYTTGSTRQLSLKNNHAKYYLDILEEQIKRIKKGIPFGLWSTAAYFVATDSTTSSLLANLYRGCVVGEDSNVESFAVNVWNNNASSAIVEYLYHSQQPRFIFNGLNVSAGSIVTSEELAIHLSLPQSSIPGLLVREEESFGRNVQSDIELCDHNSIEIGLVRHLGEDYEDEPVRLSVNGLSKHTFVTGTTGSGKSNTLYGLISQLSERYIDCSGLGEQFKSDKIKFLIIEPAKGEYKEVFGHRDDVFVYGSNPRLSDLLTINPFVFPEDIDVYEHIDALVEIFNACWPMYAAMPQVLKHSIIEAYKACGWDLLHSFNPDGLYPTIVDVVDCLKAYINSSEYSSDTKGDYKGSLETRLQSLCDGIVGRMFNAEPIPEAHLFNENVIIDLSRIKSSETKSLLMGLLILKLNEFRTSEHKGMNLPLRHITVLEEAHNLLKRTSTDQTSEGSNVAGMAVEKIANSMAEMRTYGEGFIIADQSPAMLDRAAIRNTNTKIVMALPEKDDREISGKALGLDDKHIEELSRLKTGEAIVYQTGWEESVKTKIKLFNIKSKTWKYEPKIDTSDKDRPAALSLIFDILAQLYSGLSNIINIPYFLQLLQRIRLSGGRLHSVIDKFDSVDDLSSDDVAFLFATIIGVDLFELAKSENDFNLFNMCIIRELNNIIGSKSELCSMTHVNMYIRGCCLMQGSDFYERWLKELSNNL